MLKRFPETVPHVRLTDINKTISPLRTQSSEGRVTTAEAVVILLKVFQKPKFLSLSLIFLKEMGEKKEKTDKSDSAEHPMRDRLLDG